MAISKSKPMKFTPTGVTDADDASMRFPGACTALTNLVFSQQNPEEVESRPGVLTLANFMAAGFSNPSFISLQVAVGPRIYGTVATSRNSGNDEPFVYDTSTNSFITVGGTISSATTPTSPATTGDWTPPTLTSVGVMVIVTHPGFTGGGGHFFGWFDISTYTSPVWHSGNTATNGLPTVPIAVANFNDRAYFACSLTTGFTVNNELFYTDVLTNPPTITNASQALTVGDASAITALSGLPLTTTSSGIIGALTVFKATQVWQVTGDTTTSDLALTYVSLTIGTNMPRSVAQAPYGLYFIGAGGPYYLDQLGILKTVTHDLNNLEPDINVAFQNAITPSRWAGAYTATMYRICGQTTLRGVGQFVDYWFDEHKRRWTGPHTFIYDCATGISGYFVISSANNPGQLIRSDPNQLESSVFTDLGTVPQFFLESSTFPKTNDELMKQVAESTIELAVTGGTITYTIEALNDQKGIMGTVTIIVANGPLWNNFYWNDGTLWSQANVWGGGARWGAPPVGSGILWGEAQSILRTYPVQWQEPLVFDKMALRISGLSNANVGIGTFYARYQQTGYQAWFPGTQSAVGAVVNGI